MTRSLTSAPLDLASEQQKRQAAELEAMHKNEFEQLLRRDVCSRQSLMAGIATGLSMGLLRYYRRPNVISALNWTFGSFLVVSALGWPVCVARRGAQLRRSRVMVEALKPSSLADDTTILAAADQQDLKRMNEHAVQYVLSKTVDYELQTSDDASNEPRETPATKPST